VSHAYRPTEPTAVTAHLAHPEGTGWTLVFVRDLRHARAAVWTALTEPGQLAEWAPFTASRDLGTPGAGTLTMTDGESTLELPAEVRVAEPPSRLEYTWGEDLLRWDLAATPTGTRLTLWHTVSDHDLLAQVAAGWHICLDVAERLLDGRPVGPIIGRHAEEHGWSDLRDAYAAQLPARVH
jgi:uncharacterized protein YndB with AHSA1/START domain